MVPVLSIGSELGCDEVRDLFRQGACADPGRHGLRSGYCVLQDSLDLGVQATAAAFRPLGKHSHLPSDERGWA